MRATTLLRLRPASPGRRAVATRAEYELPPASRSQPGDRLLPLLRTPFDALALGPRVTLGALSSLPELLQQVPEDLEKLSILIQDPRPLDQKQALVIEEVEGRVARFMEKGISAEREALGGLSSALPAPLREALPAELREALDKAAAPAEMESPAGDGYGWTAAPAPSTNAGKPLATWTITSDDEGYGPPVVVTPEELSASQTAAEVAEVRAAVVSLRECLEALKANADASKAGMLKLNLSEARAALDRRLGQLQPESGAGGDVDAAVAEAALLLSEVQALA